MEKLRDLRGQPLLSPPADANSLQVTPRDVEIMVEELADCRVRVKWAIAGMHYFLAGLGYPQEITRQDRADIMSDFNSFRPGTDSVLEHGEKAYRLSRLGLLRDPTREADGVRAGLMKDRVRGFGYSVANGLCLLRDLGAHEEATADDKRMIEAAVKDGTGGRRGQDAAHLLSMARELGLEAEPGLEDVRLIESTLAFAREKRRGMELAETLYYANKVFGGGAPDTPRMPPLKRFI